jgi:hypothetical protein
MRHLISPATLVLLSFALTPDARCQSDGDRWFPELDPLLVQDDPWPRATGADAAGGWGVGAIGANPAAIGFGQEASGSASLPWSEGPTHMAIGVRSRLGPTAGFSLRGSENQSPLLTLVIGYRADTSRALALAIKHREGDRTNSRWMFDLGFRWERIFPRLTLVERGATLLPFSRSRWQPGMAFGLAIRNMAGTGYVPTSRDPLTVSIGLSYKPVVSRTLCLSLNASHNWFERTPERTQDSRPRALLRRGSSAVGLGVELHQTFELGLSVHAGFADRVPRLVWSAAAGPPCFRIIWSAGADAMEPGLFGASFVDRFTVRMYFPAEFQPRSKESREPPSPYSYWPDK